MKLSQSLYTNLASLQFYNFSYAIEVLFSEFPHSYSKCLFFDMMTTSSTFPLMEKYAVGFMFYPI